MAYELGYKLSEVREMPQLEFTRWVAFLKILGDERKKAQGGNKPR